MPVHERQSGGRKSVSVMKGDVVSPILTGSTIFVRR